MVKPPNTAAVLAVIASLIVAGIMAALFTTPIPDDNRDLVLQLGSAVVTGWGVALSFYFGGQNAAKPHVAPGTAQITAAPDVDVAVRDADTGSQRS
jgi:membrane associated rhomboid family serine protease